jgi:quercetin dioxygenase-like cupin family protein
MAESTGMRAPMGLSSGEAASEVLLSPNLRVEALKLAAGEGLDWQRGPVSDRVFVVTEGRGYAYRSHGRDEIRDEIAAGDVVFFKRLVWHRIIAGPDEALSGALVTSPPLEVEFRR